MTTLWQDIRYGARMLWKNPGFTVVAVAALALGIGATTTIFSIINAVLLRPLPYAEAERLVMVWMDNRQMGMNEDIHSWPNLNDYREQNRVFEALAAYRGASANLTGEGEPERILGAAASANFFEVMRVAPVAGRVFTAEEDRQGSDRVILISHGLWRRRFGADPQLVGRDISLNGVNRTVIGIMPPDFRFPSREAEFWMPLAAPPQFTANRETYWLTVIGRLRPDATLEQARAEMEGIARRLEEQYPATNRGMGVNLVSLREQTIGRVRPALLVLLGAVGFVLLIACANVANLLLARAGAREREFAVRAAIGAGRLRIIRQLLVESALLALVGGALGVLLAVWGLDALKLVAPADMPRLDQVGVDARALAFTLGVASLTALLFGLAPALQAANANLSDTLKEGGKGAMRSVRSRRLRRALVVSEIALALVLLIGAGLLLKSFARLQATDLGFRTEGLLTARLQLPASKYARDDQRAAFFNQLLERLGSVPGVEAAGTTTSVFLSSLPNSAYFNIEGRPRVQAGERVEVPIDTVSSNYFQTIGVPITRGRAFSARDSRDAPPVIIINETLARRFFANEDPLGRRIVYGDNPDPEQNPWRTIVGVVADTRRTGVDAEVRPETFLPMVQDTPGAMTIVVRTASSDPVRLASIVRNEVWRVDRDQPVYAIKTMNDVVAGMSAQRRLNTILLGIFAVVALALAAIGIYGVMNYTVTQRTHEIGIRLALGAQQRDVLRLVVGQGMLLAALGVAAGLIGAFALTRLMASLLYGVSTTDPLTFVGVPVLLAGVALVACYLPARRAMKVDPMVALRYE